MRTIAVLLVDDHAMVREALREVLEIHADLHVVGEAADGARAVELARDLSPDVVVMDVRLPDFDGLEATRRMLRERPDIKIVLLSAGGAETIGDDARRVGASTFLRKDAAFDSLAPAIRSAVGR